ncbi:TonB-dependent receptor [Flavivirga eckloniae]|uniref:TonB-dependent receptor n=1 Tax=Flavivirga eckloniae TaxID=1803846 RepID=A0A2K9PV60_9FLAO|nr:TonB-dependent receptor [Flavivirga eckloniae]AUP80944.1 TonB-dependent receptor [Flavivirga eckloniae]
MVYKILGIWLYFSLCSIAHAQDSFKIKGIVINANSLKPIEGANIVGENLNTISNANGEFHVENLSKGAYTLKVTHLGYIPEMFTIQADSKKTEVIIAMKIAATILKEVEIRGKTKKREISELPTVSYTISEEFLKKNRENSLMQTLEKVPGVSTINIGSGQSKPVIRGLGFNRVVVVQNGIKHEAQQWGNDHGLEIDQYGIENIQVIKGPASLLYGSDAIAGVVDIQPSKVPLQNSFTGEVNLLGESNNNLLGVSSGIQARTEKWFYRSRLTFRDYGDYKVPADKIRYENYIFKLHDNNLRNTAGREVNGSIGIGYISENVKSETTFSNVFAKNGFFANAHGLEVRTSSIDYDGSNRDIDLPYHKVNHLKITNNTSIAGNKHTFHFDLGYQNNHREEHSEPVPHGYMPKPSDTKEREFNKNTYALNSRGVFKSNHKQKIVAGLNLELQENTIDGWGFLIPEYNRLTIGLFAYDHFEIRPDLHMQAGLRYDHGFIETKSYYDWYTSPIKNNDGTTSYINQQRAQNKNLDFGNVSASLGLSHVRQNTTYKINVGKSFRMPLANELTSDGVNYHMYRFEKGNLDLDAEESYQLDIEINHTAKKFNVSISPFVNFFENYIYLNPTPNYHETLQIYEYTQSKVFRFGGEITVSTKLFENLKLDVLGEYVYSKQTNGPKKGFTLPFSPPLTALFSANYQFKNLLFLKKPQLIADYRLIASQNQIVPPEEITKGAQVLNMSLLTEMAIFKSNPPIELRLKLNNVFNSKYFNHTSFYRLIDVPEAGRNISLSLTIPFNKS